ncbi:U2 small nuclear ribonucleoprotein auxiliary factor 35 kDa subunit-related protein 2 [Morone saxatilis]|uniref:U2 small nuclear ribonucleoprotein auxiliary factor 35 kDa subunit-related protein 2 n=1 Tax=Morone saxatilis TaxID=34816 RepID=UPI0015E24437|nr:U2 small nuclear ribonucleoprotein auxiliary factor 35 kDa subunit-related protein 2 [Morone saxatilis]
MAAPTPLSSAPVLSQKQRRAALRKERRKRKRQALAQARGTGLKNGASYAPDEEEDEEINDEDDEDNGIAEEERLRLHEEWLEKERLAQEVFRLRFEREEAARKRKEEEERMIKEEWEAQQRKEQEEKEQKQQEKRGREEAVQKMLDEAENQLDNGGPWMNPEAPVTENSENFGTERDVANCPFFLKTGACRFGDRCSRKHVHPTASPTLMIRGMFITFGMEESRRDDYDIDAWLEHSEEELQESFLDFYHDVLPELKSIGKVVQFKVSCNYEPHLRGNVYVQFDTEEQCKDALIKFNGRWYAGRQLHCEICPVTRWKNAICGLFDRQKCPKGKHCNFLHVFRNPGNEFWEADRDLHMSPDRSVRGSRRDGWQSERYGDRSWRQRHCSRSPPRSERSHSRREGDRRRSRSRERSRESRASHQHREDKWSSRSRHSERRNDWYLRPSRDRSRSRSRDREQDRLRNRSRDKDRCRNRSEERDSRDKDTDTQGKARERSRSSSREGERNKQSRERSPKKPDKNNDDTNTRRRHKQSKKSKKKSKKKHKKKSHFPEGTTSSGESEKERVSKEETEEKLTATSPSQEINEMELIQKNNELDESPCVESEKKFSLEVEMEQSNTQIPNEPAGNIDTSTS